MMKKFLAVMLAGLMAATVFTGCASKEKKLLKDAYKDYFSIGAAIGDYSISRYENDLLPHFNSLTAETDFKWSVVHPGEQRYTFEKADYIVEYAKKTGKKIRGHVLVWHRSIPMWVLGDNPTQEVLLARMKDHIKTVVKHFGDSVYCWDVVNEVISQQLTQDRVDKGDIYRVGEEWTDGYNTNDWLTAYGSPMYIVEAFKTAREALDELGLTDIKLYYNDVALFDPLRRQALVQLVTFLKDNGAPIDGIGEQAHIDVVKYSPEEFEATVKLVTDMGLDLQVTELDVSVYPWVWEGELYDELPEDIEKTQAAVYGDVFRILRKYAKPSSPDKGRVTNVTVWTIADDLTWLDTDPIPGRKNWPAIWDVDHNAKSAYDAIVDF